MRQFTLDNWSSLNFIDAAMGDGTTRPPNVPDWVPADDARRVAAYWVLAAMRENCRRYYLPEPLWHRPIDTRLVDGATHVVEAGKSPAEKYREYGDPALFVEQAVSLLLGESQDVVVPDAAPLADDAAAEDKAAQARAATFDEWLQGWADAERLLLRLYESEEDTVALGDGVLVLGWDADAGRPRLRKFDTESYFPVLSGDQDVDEFPNKIHFAWVEKTPVDGKEWLHRLTYDRRRLPDNQLRRYSYAPDDPSPWTVYQSHAKWDLAYVDRGMVYDLADANAVYVRTPPTPEFPDGRDIDELDIGVDFVPVVHVPNTPAGSKHFGRSLFLSVAQLLDDLGFADSDLAASSEFVGNAPLVVTGGAGSGALDRGPGAQHNLPAGASAAFLDTSKLLDGQIGFVEHLLSRLSVNTRLAEALLGRIKPNEVPSGVALGLGFAPTKSLISKMRLVRSEKFPLILKFAMRFGQVFGDLPDGPTPRAEVRLGNFLPADKQAAVDQVTKLLPVHGMSVATAVQTLVEAGFSVDDAEDEVARIKSEWAAAATEILTATDNIQAAADWLGVDPGTPPTPPAA